MRLRITTIGVCAMLCAAAAGAQYDIDTVAEGLDFPWSIAFVPDGSMLVTERSGQLRLIRDGELRDAPVSGVPDVYAAGQGGLFDVVLDPDFKSNRSLYLTYAHGTRRSNATRVAKATFDGSALSGLTVVFTATPLKSTPHHFGGRLVFLPDGTFLLTTGDGFNYREEALKLDNHLGKVVRLNRNGTVPTDNPFVRRAGALPEIWSYGHRNPQAIVRDTDSGTVYLHEHGPRGGDELNVIEPGRNYGWPAITYGIDYSGASISPYTELPGMEQPLVYWVPSIAPAGMAYYDADLFPEWQGDLFVAALAERTIRRLDLENGQVVDQEVLFADLGYRFRDVRVGPDGALYLLTDSGSGKVLRVAPVSDN